MSRCEERREAEGGKEETSAENAQLRRLSRAGCSTPKLECRRAQNLISFREDFVDFGERDGVGEGFVELACRGDAARGTDECAPRDSG